MAILRIHLKIMDLEEEGVETTLIEEEVEVDLTLMEVKYFISQTHQGFSLHNNQNSTYQSHAPAHALKADRPTCKICWKSGHFSLDCYHRMNFAYQGKNPPAKLAAMASAINAAITNN